MLFSTALPENVGSFIVFAGPHGVSEPLATEALLDVYHTLYSAVHKSNSHAGFSGAYSSQSKALRR